MKYNNIFSFFTLSFLLILAVVTPALAITNSNYTIPKPVSSATHPTSKVIQTASTIKDICPCIVFRLDDVQAYYLHNVQMKIIDQFQKKNASLTIGIIGYDIGKDKTLVSYLNQKLVNGTAPIEMANHGWRHENFANLNQVQQVSLLNKTNQELQKTFGQKPIVFITPFNLFNNSTLKALHQIKIPIISSGISEDTKYVTTKGKVTLNKDSQGLYHLPSMTDFQIDIGNETFWTKIPQNKIIASINSHIKAIGYDVVLLHPENFAKIVNHAYVDTPDATELNEIASIIDYAKSHHIRITTLSSIVGLAEKNPSVKTKLLTTNHSNTVPVIHSVKKPHVNLYTASQIFSTPSKVLPIMDPSGMVEITMKYPNHDRIEYQSVSLKIYQDSNETVFRQYQSITGNPYDITSLPLGHQYKIQVYVDDMLSSTDYVNLDTAQQALDVGIPNGGSIRVTAYYNDGQTPIPNANIQVKSQDNKTRASDVTDPNGQTIRFYLPSTNIDTNYYNIHVQIDDHLSYSYPPISLQPDDAQEVKIVTPWPPVVSDLLTVKVSDQSKLLTSANRPYVIDIYNDKGNKISESKINIHGEAHFWNLKAGYYVFRAFDTISNSELGSLSAIVDGTKNDFTIPMNQNKY